MYDNSWTNEVLLSLSDVRGTRGRLRVSAQQTHISSSCGRFFLFFPLFYAPHRTFFLSVETAAAAAPWVVTWPREMAICGHQARAVIWLRRGQYANEF